MFVKSKIISTPHAFSTRSQGDLWLSNPAHHSNAANNFATFIDECKINPKYVAYCNQIHSSNIAIVNKSDFFDCRSAGEYDDSVCNALSEVSDSPDSNTPPSKNAFPENYTSHSINISTNSDTSPDNGVSLNNNTLRFFLNDNCDGLITNEVGIALCIFTADCAPCLLYEPKAKIIAALHCGWKPFVADIEGHAITKIKEMGGHPKNIQAAIGPCIQKCCFEVGDNVKIAFKDLLGSDYKSCIDGNYADLPKGVALRLRQLGVHENNIEIINECTSCNVDKYYSYRRGDVDSGRLAHIIYMEDN